MAHIDDVYKPNKFCCDSSEAIARKHPHHHRTFFNRPDLTRRRFFEIAGAGLLGSYLVGKAKGAELVSQAGVVTQNKAKNLIFIQLTGAISPWDTFDLKTAAGSSPNL